jgi:hypothetical protein
MHLINNGEKQPDPNALEFIKYRTIGKKYSQWRAIFAEASGESDTLLKMTLLQGFNIRIDNEDADPVLYIIQDTAQMRELAEQGVHNPTHLQLLMSTKVVSFSEQDAIEQMQRWMQANAVNPTLS